MEPESPEAKSAIALFFIVQTVPGIKGKLQRLGTKSLGDLVIVAEKVFSGKEKEEEKQLKAEKLMV